MSNMVVATNVLALNSHRNMKGVGTRQAQASARLSSGYKINSAADDAAGLAISEKMRSQIRGLDMASKNSQDAISLIQTAEGGMQEIDNMIQRIRELTVQSANDTNENNDVGTGDRQKMQDEIGQLTKEIDSMADRVEFNKKKVINGSFSNTKDQLAVAQKEYDDFSAQKVASDATMTALTDKLGPVDGSDAASAYGKLKAAQDVLDGTTGTEAFGEAKGDMATAQVDYDMSKAQYADAKRIFMEEMSNAGLSDYGALDDAILNAAGHEDLKAAATAYITAAKDLGLDELNLQGSGTDITAASAGVNIAAADADTTMPTDLSTAKAGSAMKKYDTAEKAMETAQATYDSQIATRDTAQGIVDGIKTKITDQQKESKPVNAQYIAATTKLDAAKAADKAGDGKELYFQVGANAQQGLNMSINSVKTDALGIGDGKGKSFLNVVKDTGSDITSSLAVLDTALSYVTTERSKLGAAQNRLDYTIKSLDVSSENLSAAESRIRDTDMAKEMMKLTQANVLQQASMSMLAQANQAPQGLLQLLQ